MPDPSPLVTLRLLSYNIQHGVPMSAVDTPNVIRANVERQAGVVCAHHADVVALQEVDRHCQRSASLDEASIFARITGLEHHRFEKFQSMPCGGHYGMAMLTTTRRFAQSSFAVVALPDGLLEPRVALVCNLDFGEGVLLQVVNVHFDWLDNPQWRVEQARALLEHLSLSSHHPCIVIGDFNAERRSETLELFAEYGFENVDKRGAMTWDAQNPSMEIDHVCVRDSDEIALTVDRVEVVDEREASDHRPLLAVVSLRRK